MRRYKLTGDTKHLKRFYDESSYTDGHVRIKPKWAAKFRLIKRLMDLSRHDQILDIGCAHKGLKPYVESSGATYSGVDIADGFKPDYVADAETLQGVPADFDWTVMADVLEHLAEPEKALTAARSVSNHMIAVVPNWYRLECLGKLLPRDPYDRHLQMLQPRAWLQTVRESGWHIKHIRGFFYVPSIAFYPFKLLKRMDSIFLSAPFRRLTVPFDRYLSDKPVFKYMGQELVIVASKYKAGVWCEGLGTKDRVRKIRVRR